METAGFVFGLSGLISVFEKVCGVWYAIGAARDFGDDVEGSIRKLEIEFFRFQSWWKAIQKLEVLPVTQGGQSSFPEMPLLAVHLSISAQNPIPSIAQNILGILLDIERVLRKSGVLEVMEGNNSPSGLPRNIMPVQPKHIRDQVSDAALAKTSMSRQLMSAISWRTRVKHDATPWRQSDKSYLESKLQEMVYWNDVLYNILPLELKDSILRQGISGYVLADPDEATALSKLNHGALGQQARLLEAHRKITSNDSQGSFTLEQLRQRLLNINLFNLIISDELFSIIRSPYGQQSYLVEWYQLPVTAGTGFEQRHIACERLAKLSILLCVDNKPTTLCAANSIGYVEGDHLHRLGLVSIIPDSISITTLPVPLYNLLCRKPLPGTSSRAPLPTLSQRFMLATALSSSLYTFMLARWHHKMFNSLNIYFMFPEKLSNLPNLNNPLVGGYSVSRPSTMDQISICGAQTSVSETYLHPQLRVPVHRRPKYVRSYEIYSLGLLLAEIGFWQPISKITATNSPRNGGYSAEGLKDAIIAKCSSDLACWMGQQYRDVTLRCLRVGDEPNTGVDNGLTDFYWNVILELVRCTERVKVFTSF